MRTLMRRLAPTSFDDIAALVALYRPGPMKNIDRFANVGQILLNHLFDKFVVNGVAPTLSMMTRKGASSATVQVGSVLQGAAGSGGKASGRARVVLDAADQTNEWREFADARTLPYALNPGEGFLVSANNRPAKTSRPVR